MGFSAGLNWLTNVSKDTTNKDILMTIGSYTIGEVVPEGWRNNNPLKGYRLP